MVLILSKKPFISATIHDISFEILSKTSDSQDFQVAMKVSSKKVCLNEKCFKNNFYYFKFIKNT